MRYPVGASPVATAGAAHAKLMLEAVWWVEFGASGTAEEVDMEALLLMDEADIADLGLAKGARVKLRSYLRKNFSDYEG